MSQSIRDFSAVQISAVQALVNKRYGKEMELHLGDVELKIDAEDLYPTPCPVIFWNGRECNFMLVRTSEDEFQAQYFYNEQDRFSTLQATFSDAESCALAVLREQADNEREHEMAISKAKELV